MSDLTEFKTARLKQIRRIILELLKLVGATGANESIIISVVNSRKLNVTTFEMRNELDYLAQRKVIALDRGSTWFAKLTPEGGDIIDGITSTPDWMAPE